LSESTKKLEVLDLPKDFESALKELEEIVQSMESDVLSLEASLQAYERGVALSRVCQERLDAAEQQVQVLQNNLLRPAQIEAE